MFHQFQIATKLTSGMKKYLFDPIAKAEMNTQRRTVTSWSHERMENFLLN
jgi:hypothetical protein